ncbi:MAG TPA: DUF1653 domain-containing protein [Candidatus Paceibacterota bacterium]|nr:DUF1653 domain-containing protein [Candidatus Paceibacterota bacterium]
MFFSELPGQVVPGIYQHYKGPKYMILGVARHANTEERSVVYMPLEPHGDEMPMLTNRPVGGEDGFFTPAVVDGKQVVRFKLLWPINTTQLARPKI